MGYLLITYIAFLVIVLLFFYFLFQWAFRALLGFLLVKAITSQIDDLKGKLKGAGKNA
jgi:hypothetical protein